MVLNGLNILQKIPEKPIEIKLIFKPKTNAIGGRIVGETMMNIINFLNLKFNKPKTLAAGNAMIIETIVTKIPIVKLLTKALITVGFDAHSLENLQKFFVPV